MAQDPTTAKTHATTRRIGVRCVSVATTKLLASSIMGEF
jgi:hypothetical protein